MKNIMDMQSAIMGGRLNAQVAFEDIMREYGEPVGMMQLVMLMQSLPPGVHQALGQMIPDAHRAIMQKMQGG